MSKKHKLGPLRKRLKERTEDELSSRLVELINRIAMDNREIGAIKDELKGRAK